MPKKTPPDTIGFIAAVGNPLHGGPSAPSIIPKMSCPPPKAATNPPTDWVEATELPTDEQLAAAWSLAPASVRVAFGRQPKLGL